MRLRVERGLAREIVVFALVLLCALFVALDGTLFFTRIDLTEHKRFTIAPVSRELFREITDRVQITYYVSGKLRTLTPVPGRIIDVLDEYAASSHGKIEVLVEDQIAKGVNAVLAVPNDPASLVSAFKRAHDNNVIVVTHEAANQAEADYDVEAFDNNAYGRHMMDMMAQDLGYKGLWQPFVGHLTSTSHNEWVDGEEAQAKAKYPDIRQAATRIEEQENQQIAYQKTLELLKTYPDLKAVMGSAMSTVPGAAQAITEKGLIGKVAAYGTCLPSVAGDYIASGAAKQIHFWIPSDAGYAAARIAYETLKGNKITDGFDLGKPGYNKVTIKTNSNGVPVVYGQAWIDVDKGNLDQWKGPDGKWKL